MGRFIPGLSTALCDEGAVVAVQLSSDQLAPHGSDAAGGFPFGDVGLDPPVRVYVVPPTAGLDRSVLVNPETHDATLAHTQP